MPPAAKTLGQVPPAVNSRSNARPCQASVEVSGGENSRHPREPRQVCVGFARIGHRVKRPMERELHGSGSVDNRSEERGVDFSIRRQRAEDERVRSKRGKPFSRLECRPTRRTSIAKRPVVRAHHDMDRQRRRLQDLREGFRAWTQSAPVRIRHQFHAAGAGVFGNPGLAGVGNDDLQEARSSIHCRLNVSIHRM